MADRKLAGEADQQVQRRDQHPVDADDRRDMQVIEIAGDVRQQRREARANSADDGRADMVVLHTWRTCVVPNNPCGRTTSSRISRPMAMVF